MSQIDPGEHQQLRERLTFMIQDRDRALEMLVLYKDEVHQLKSLTDENNDDYEKVLKRYDDMLLELKQQKELYASVLRRNDDLTRDYNETLAENIRLSTELGEKCREFEEIRAKNETLNKNCDDHRTLIDQLKEELKQIFNENKILREQLQEISQQKSQAFENLDAKYRRLSELIKNFRAVNLLNKNFQNQFRDIVVDETKTIFKEEIIAKTVEISKTLSVSEEKTSFDDDQKFIDLSIENVRLISRLATLTSKNVELSTAMKEKDKKIKKYRHRCDDLESETKSLKNKLRRQNDDGRYIDLFPELQRIQQEMTDLNSRIASINADDYYDEDSLQPSSLDRSSRRNRSRSPVVRRRRSEMSLTHSSTDDEERETGSLSGYNANAPMADDRTSAGSTSPAPAAFRKPISFSLAKPKRI